MIVLFLTHRPFSARMVHSRQSRTKRPFQPVFRGGKQRFSVLPTAGFRKGRGLAIGERRRRVLNRPCLSDHRFSHSPSMAYPLAGCFVSSNLLKLRHLCRFSVWQDPPCGEGRKGRFGRFSDRFSAVFLRLKRTPTFPLTRQFTPQNANILRFFLE